MVNLESETLSPNKAPRQRSNKGWTGAVGRLSIVLVLSIACLAVLTGCGVQGTYADATGAMTMELKSGGVATITMMGQTAQCTYTTASNQVIVDCKDAGGKTNFTVQNDGSLAGPPGSFFPVLKKK
jgi:hypothetical protein